MANLGFIWFGSDGRPNGEPAENHGHTVTGYNRTRGKAQWLIDKGDEVFRYAARGMPGGRCHLFDGHQLGGAGTGGGRSGRNILAGLGAGKLLIDMSTVSPAVMARRWWRRFCAQGADMVDAPVSGSVITLQQGKLSVMVGGTAETFRAGQTPAARCGAESDACGLKLAWRW